MRFAVYLPFKLWIIQTYFPDHSAIIYIPLTVNNLGDGPRSLLACTFLLGSGRSGIWT